MSQLPSYLSVKAQLSADDTKPPKLWTVADEEILLSSREVRSDRPEVHYLLHDNNDKEETPQYLPSTSPASAPLPPLDLDDFDSSPQPIDNWTDTALSTLSIPDGPTGPIDLATTTVPLPLPSTSVVDVGITVTANPTGTVTVTTTTVPTAAPVITTASAFSTAGVSDADELNAGVESDSEMSEAVAPSQFRGTAQEDAEKWMRHLIIYSEYRGYEEAKKLALIKVLLADGAATWLDSQPEAVTGTFDALKTAFLTRYSTPVFMRFKGAKELFNMKQQPNQTADDFVAQMRHAAKLVEADEKMLLYAVLNGLRAEVASFVTQRQPQDVKELLDFARVGELTTPPPATENESAMSVQLALVQDQLRELTTKLDTPKVASVSSSNARTQSPRRVTFWDDGSRPTRQRDFRRAESPRRFDRGGRFRMQRPSRGAGRGWRGRGRGRPTGGYSGVGFPPSEMFNLQEQCSRCGGNSHESFNACPAVNQYCNFCFKKGHFWRVCRAATQSNTY